MKKLLNFRPFLFLGVAFILGIIAVKQFICSSLLMGIVTVVVAVVLVTAGIFVCPKVLLKRNLIFSAIFMLVFVMGGTLLYANVQKFDNADLNNMYFKVTGRIESIEDKGYIDGFVIKDVITDGVVDGNNPYKIFLSVSGTHNFDIGDIIEFNALLKDNSIIYEGDLAKYDIVNGIKYSASVNVSDIALKGKYLDFFESINIFLRNSLKNGLDEAEFSVAYGMLCGNTEYMDTSLKTSYREAGVAHIFAVSGLHIGFMAGIIGFIFRKFKVKGIVAGPITVLVLFLYSGVCGFTPSSVRAAIMATVLFTSGLSGKKYDGLSSIGLASLVVLTISPVQLFCAGFQLSFGVVTGIFVLSGVFNRLFSFMPKKLNSALSTAISAQMASIPISLAHFGTFSILSVFINVIFIPIASIIFVVIFFTALIGGIFGVAGVALFVPNYILKAINFLATYFDYGIFIIGGFSFGIFAVFYCLACFVIGGKFNFNKIARITISIILSALCIFGTLFNSMYLNSKITAYVIGDKGISATLFHSDKDNILIVSNADKGFSLGRLVRSLNKTHAMEIDVLVLPMKIDAQVCVSRLLAIAEVKNVYYNNEYNQSESLALEKSFPETDFFVCNNDFVLNLENYGFSFEADGYAVKFFTENSSVLMFSEFGDNFAGYSGVIAQNLKLVVATDYAENIHSTYPSERFVTYYKTHTFENGETHGDFWVQFN